MEPRNWQLAHLLLPLVATGCVAGESADAAGDADQRAVLDVLEDYYSDFSSRDWQAVAQHFWPGADITTIWRPPGEESDRVVPTAVEEFVAQAPAGQGGKEIFEERMLDAKIRVFNNLAQAWVRYGTRFGDPDSLQYWEGIDAFALLKHGDRWKIASLVFTSDTNE
ncbi:MAG: hypothetical protein JSW71_18145 [Gemmatimonadota bacterium]|nr:MAG: hypothetical protein JSW71_18145 [Gemmatimonadota bacterium]